MKQTGAWYIHTHWNKNELDIMDEGCAQRHQSVSRKNHFMMHEWLATMAHILILTLWRVSKTWKGQDMGCRNVTKFLMSSQCQTCTCPPYLQWQRPLIVSLKKTRYNKVERDLSSHIWTKYEDTFDTNFTWTPNVMPFVRSQCRPICYVSLWNFSINHEEISTKKIRL